MAQRFNQLLAVERDVKTVADKALTGAYHDAQKGALFSGFSKTYQPLDADGELFPPESQVLQVRVNEQIKHMQAKVADLFDITQRKNAANCVAKATVELDGKPFIQDAPGSYLLWLEKKLIDMRTYASKLPRLPADEQWVWSPEQGCYIAPLARTVKTKKVQEIRVIVPATKEHPAQVAQFTDDKTIGHWSTLKYSGALPSTVVDGYMERIDVLIAAVKQARQKANSIEVPTVDPIGAKVLGFIFG